MAEKTVYLPSIRDVQESTWRKLSEKKIYFGHQSVGFNILDGIKDVLKYNPQIKLNVIETNDPNMFRTPIFAHSRVGKNTDPRSKGDNFVRCMEQGIGNEAEFAFFKFCYVDIREDTDIQKVFADYKTVITRLKEKYPKITFILFTVPLVVVQRGVKARVKKIIGRPVGGYDGNIKRNEFNDLLRKETDYPIFDLALIESTDPDGGKATFKKDGKTFYALVPGYTNNGGHLNKKGRKLVAEQLLIFLAKVLEKVN